jgi:hypothetical protein
VSQGSKFLPRPLIEQSGLFFEGLVHYGGIPFESASEESFVSSFLVQK